MLLLELGLSEDILKECVGLAAQGESLISNGQEVKAEGHNAGSG